MDGEVGHEGAYRNNRQVLAHAYRVSTNAMVLKVSVIRFVNAVVLIGGHCDVSDYPT